MGYYLSINYWKLALLLIPTFASRVFLNMFPMSIAGNYCHLVLNLTFLRKHFYAKRYSTAFSSLLSISDSLATFYGESTTLKPRVRGDKSDRIVALLSPSCADLLMTLFAAIRLGYGVLLLA